MRESPEHLIFAGRGREVLLEAVLCRGPYISVPGTPAIGGGVGGSGVGGGRSALIGGLYCERESAKVQASLNGFSSIM